MGRQEIAVERIEITSLRVWIQPAPDHDSTNRLFDKNSTPNYNVDHWDWDVHDRISGRSGSPFSNHHERRPPGLEQARHV
jgi:hypothetical protein